MLAVRSYFLSLFAVISWPPALIGATKAIRRVESHPSSKTSQSFVISDSLKMADRQPGLATPNGKIVSFDDVNAILKSVDFGRPFQVHVISTPVEKDQKRTQLQIRNCTEASTDTIKTGSGNTKHTSGPYDSRALVKQLKGLNLTEKDVLEQILASTQPSVLSELTTAHKNKSIIPLVTAKDGRVFSILAGQLAYSNWSGEYPMEFPQGPVRKLSDRALLAERITTYQRDALMRMIEAVSHTEDSREFRKSVQLLRPKIWDNYKMMIAEPVDLESMHLKLWHGLYATMADFLRHVDLLEQNARTYNGDRNRSITEAAIKLRSDIYRRMDEIPSEPPINSEVATQIRRIIYVEDKDSCSAANSDTDDANGASDEESGDTSCEETTESNSEAGYTARYTFVLPLGRLNVSRDAGGDGDGIILTPYIVVMNLETVCRDLWLVKDNYTPVRLPNDKRALLDFGGEHNFTIGMLAVSIDDWKVRRRPGPRDDLNNTQVPLLSWASVEKLIKKSSKDKMLLFDLVGTQQEAVAAIKKGWDESIQSIESFGGYEPSSDNSQDGDYIDHTGHGARKRRTQHDTGDDDDANDDCEPLWKSRTRSATNATRPLYGHY